ncbi:MAG: dihydroneopterin aldolase [Parachlamydiaceae bacterium]|nr:dihydroneopterin aldolase [Parachlamydiaceae bacterium]
MDVQHISIGFEKYRINCLIGIEPHERINEQEILVDVKVAINCSGVIKTENIQDTVDYMLLAKICKEMAREGRYQLLETYVSKVLEEMMLRFDLHSVWMRVKKPSALPGADYTYVEMQRDFK